MKFRINHPDDEHVEFFIDDRAVGRANHDSEGWDGMSAMINLFEQTAHQLDAEIETTHEDEEE